MGPSMMKHVMEKKHLPNLHGLLKSAVEQKVRLVACTMSMEAMGITAEELIDGVEFGGVADFLGSSQKSGTNLFI
jgi:peroxiredoxin family protein